jgi:membrane protease YdiL (CAAX protease family)
MHSINEREVSTMSTPSIATPAVDLRARQREEVDRYEAVRQYSLAAIVALWAAATVPMAVLAWIVAPWLSHHLGGREPLGEALLICFNAGLVWILVLTLMLVRREQGSLEWSRMRDALWLRPPRDPKTRRVGGKVWWWVLPFALLSAGLEALPIDPTGPIARDFPNFISTDRAERFYSGAWGWFALTVMVALLAPWVEELFFRGLLLPRMRSAFGKGDWVANGAIFTAYHLHQPWSMPATLLDGIFAQAYPAKRFRSIWIAVVGHTLPSFVMIGVVLSLVLK